MSLLVYSINLSVFISLGWAVFQVIVRKTYQQYGHLTPAVALLQSLVFFTWGLLTWIDLPPNGIAISPFTFLNLAGFLCIILGLSGMFSIIAWFNLRRALGIQVTGLIQRGPYAISRNPQIVCGIVAAIGYLMIWKTIHAVGWIAAIISIMNIMIRTEEEHLKRKFGNAYEEYCRKVPRFLGMKKK